MPQFCLDHLSLVHLDALTLIEAAAQAGFAAVSLFAAPIPISPALDLTRDAAALAQVRRTLRETGLTVGIVEPFMLTPAIDWVLLERLVEVAAELGGTVNILGMDDDPGRLDDSAARLAALCRAARVPAVIEAFPLSVVATPRQALALADRLDPEIGLCLDSLHVIRGGGSWADVTALPPARIRHVQLSDGPLDPPADRGREAALERMLPGDGAFRLEKLLPLLPAHATIAAEAPVPQPPGATPAEAAARLMASMQKLYAGAARV